MGSRIFVIAGAVILAAAAPASAAKPVAGGGGGNQTGQGVMVNLDAQGTFTFTETDTYSFNLPTAGTYFTTAVSGPAVSCTGSSTNCASTNQPPAPAAPDATADTNIVAGNNKCSVFFPGGTLAGGTNTQSTTINGLNTKGNWTFTWTYTTTPNVASVASLTAWDLVHANGGGGASIPITAQIAGESVLISKQYPAPGKFSFSLIDGTGNRVQNLVLTVTDTTTNAVQSGAVGSTVAYPVDFQYKTNAGSNGTGAGYLQDGDDISILNNDVFAGNNNGGADGSAAALATMDPVVVTLGADSYNVNLAGTVKGNSVLNTSDISFSVTQHLNVIGESCGVLH